MAEENNLKQTVPENIEQKNQDVPLQLPELTEVDMLSAKVVELENSANQYKDQLLRKAAEFDNYKKRIESDYANLVKFANEELIEKFLPVIDDFDRSFNALKNLNSDDESFIKGVELIYQKFQRILEMQGVKPLNVVGQPFDPELHDALLLMPSKDHPSHTVLQEVEKGYMLNDKVIRHAKVIVSAEPQSSDESVHDNLSEAD